LIIYPKYLTDLIIFYLCQHQEIILINTLELAKPATPQNKPTRLIPDKPFNLPQAPQITLKPKDQKFKEKTLPSKLSSSTTSKSEAELLFQGQLTIPRFHH
jgi:hypothetical protein